MISNALRLKGNQIFLRPVTPEDISSKYVDWLNDTEVNQYLETKYQIQTLDTVRSFVMEKLSSKVEFLFAICDIQTESHLGNIKIGPVNSNHKTADISLFIGDKNYWRKGVAAEAIYLISKFAFEELNLNKLKAGCYARNTGSAKAFEKCGYLREGVLRNSIIFEGKSEASYLYGLIPSELVRPYKI